MHAYLTFVISFTRAKFLENKIYIEKIWQYPELRDLSVPFIRLKGSIIFDSKSKRCAFLDFNWFAFWSNKPLKWFDWCHGFCYQGCRNGEHEVKNRKEGWPHPSDKASTCPLCLWFAGSPATVLGCFAEFQTERWRENLSFAALLKICPTERSKSHKSKHSLTAHIDETSQ